MSMMLASWASIIGIMRASSTCSMIFPNLNRVVYFSNSMRFLLHFAYTDCAWNPYDT